MIRRSSNRSRSGWTRTGDPTLPGKGAPHVHDASGLRVEHCGHPTANWPYMLRDASDRMIVAPNGFGFRTMADAQLAAERVHATAASIVDVGWSPSYREYVARVIDREEAYEAEQTGGAL